MFVYFTWPELLPWTFFNCVRGLLELDPDLSRLALGLPLRLAPGLSFLFLIIVLISIYQRGCKRIHSNRVPAGKIVLCALLLKKP